MVEVQERPTGFRWLLVAAALLLQFSIGAVYAWSVFGGALEEAEAWQLSKVEASLPFTVTIGMIFVGSFLGGRLQDLHGPRIVALIGGVSLFGGMGTVTAAALGLLLMQVVRTGLVISNVNTHWQTVAVGAIMVAAVALDLIRRRARIME